LLHAQRHPLADPTGKGLHLRASFALLAAGALFSNPWRRPLPCRSAVTAAPGDTKRGGGVFSDWFESLALGDAYASFASLNEPKIAALAQAPDCVDADLAQVRAFRQQDNFIKPAFVLELTIAVGLGIWGRHGWCSPPVRARRFLFFSARGRAEHSQARVAI